MRISLSLKALAADPWLDAVAGFVVGQRLNGTVTKMMTFGAFVEIAPGMEGLVHVSELGAGRRINHPREVVKLGEAVEVTILQIDPEKRRIGLSMGAKERMEEADNAEHGRTMTAAPAKLGTFADLLAKAQDKKKR
jgi:small subunit ribosomal protein S1